jgi:hypothetical protein
VSADVSAAIRQGARFVAAAQLTAGNFESFSSPERVPFVAKRTYQTTFTPSIILGALSQLPEQEIQKTRERLAGWLLTQKNADWAFSYWASEEPARNDMVYPPDLDDTFCALSALHAHKPALIDATCLGRVVQLLIATESQVGGPYRTWLVANDAPQQWQDIDLAVNSNIACFLALVAEPLPSLTAFMELAITTNNLTSPYYPSSYPLAYYLARAYDGPKTAKLAKQLLDKQKQGYWETPLQTALAVSALTQLGLHDSCDKAVAYLLQTQQPDGSWPAEAFCLDPILDGKKYYSGAPTLTTALALEALARFSRPDTTPAKPGTKRTDNKQRAMLHNRILAAAQADVRRLDPSLLKPSQAILERIAARDTTNEITLLPYLFWRDLLTPAKQPDEFFVHLGLANLYGWAAYTIYDDFLDNEGEPKLLSAANVCMRRSLAAFEQALPGQQAFQDLVRRTFDTVDGANAWEVAHCRFAVHDKGIEIATLPNFGRANRLAERSLGHALGPMGVLAASGVTLDGPAAASMIEAFKHYLIARQLNDDMHDWEPDLRNGIVTYVTVKIIEDFKLPHGHTAFTSLVPVMQRQFWHHTLPVICNTITAHTKKARLAVQKSGLLQPDNVLLRRLDTIEASVTHTLEEQSSAQDFLASYNG